MICDSVVVGVGSSVVVGSGSGSGVGSGSSGAGSTFFFRFFLVDILILSMTHTQPFRNAPTEPFVPVSFNPNWRFIVILVVSATVVGYVKRVVAFIWTIRVQARGPP